MNISTKYESTVPCKVEQSPRKTFLNSKLMSIYFSILTRDQVFVNFYVFCPIKIIICNFETVGVNIFLTLFI